MNHLSIYFLRSSGQHEQQNQMFLSFLHSIREKLCPRARWTRPTPPRTWPSTWPPWAPGPPATSPGPPSRASQRCPSGPINGTGPRHQASTTTITTRTGSTWSATPAGSVQAWRAATWRTTAHEPVTAATALVNWSSWSSAVANVPFNVEVGSFCGPRICTLFSY